MDIKYLSTKDVIIVHFLVMKKHGEGEQAGIKVQSLLDSAVHRPQQSAYLNDAYPTLFEKASALFESLARNHCFYNGNKRTAFAALDIFLKKNGYQIRQNTDENEKFTISVAKGEMGFAEIVSWLGNNTKKR